MKRLNEFYKLEETNKEVELSDISKLTVTKNGKTTTHTDENGKTVEEAKQDEEEDIKKED
jgi:hypothetical protein